MSLDECVDDCIDVWMSESIDWWGHMEGDCSMAVPAMSTRLRMPSTHPAIRNANYM